MQTINIKAYTENTSRIEAITAVMKALKIKYEISKGTPYNPEFVEMIEQSRQDYLAGKGTVFTVDEIGKLWK